MPDLEEKYRKKFNTKLEPDLEKEYKNFTADESIRRGRDITMDEGAYDVRGAWKELGQSNAKFAPGHGTDRYKKPNHPTFSDESIYANKKNPGGSWLLKDTFIAPPTNEFRGGRLKEYMSKYEPGINLVQLKKKKK